MPACSNRRRRSPWHSKRDAPGKRWLPRCAGNVPGRPWFAIEDHNRRWRRSRRFSTTSGAMGQRMRGHRQRYSEIDLRNQPANAPRGRRAQGTDPASPPTRRRPPVSRIHRGLHNFAWSPRGRRAQPRFRRYGSQAPVANPRADHSTSARQQQSLLVASWAKEEHPPPIRRC